MFAKITIGGALIGGIRGKRLVFGGATVASVFFADIIGLLRRRIISVQGSAVICPIAVVLWHMFP